MTKIASFDVDAQNCFTPICPEELPVPEGDLIASFLNQQAELADLRLGSKDAHSPDAIWVATKDAPQFTPVEGANVDIRWVKHAVPGTIGFDLLKTLPAPADYYFFVWKGIELDMHPYGACYHDLQDRLSTGVLEFLAAQNVSTVLVGGLATDYCVKTTALQLCRAGFRVLLHLDACRGIAPETISTALQEMTEAGIEICQSIPDLQKALSTTP